MGVVEHVVQLDSVDAADLQTPFFSHLLGLVDFLTRVPNLGLLVQLLQWHILPPVVVEGLAEVVEVNAAHTADFCLASRETLFSFLFLFFHVLIHDS